jgi:hypothetical protein
MKAFVSHVDSPLGFSLSRLLSQTVVGARHEEEPPAEEEQPPNEEETIKALEEKVKTTYSVIGSFTPFKHVLPDDPEFAMACHHPSFPGNFFETADKKKDAARREAIAKFATPGQKPKWVSEIVPVLPLFMLLLDY